MRKVTLRRSPLALNATGFETSNETRAVANFHNIYSQNPSSERHEGFPAAPTTDTAAARGYIAGSRAVT
jgi:hypothetical protein